MVSHKHHYVKWGILSKFNFILNDIGLTRTVKVVEQTST
jgi:hypothetical protein